MNWHSSRSRVTLPISEVAAVNMFIFCDLPDSYRHTYFTCFLLLLRPALTTERWLANHNRNSASNLLIRSVEFKSVLSSLAVISLHVFCHWEGLFVCSGEQRWTAPQRPFILPANPSVSTEATDLLTSPCRHSRVAGVCTHFPVSQRTLVTANDQNCLICPALITPLSPN